MSEQRLTVEEHGMMQDTFAFLRDHCVPPPNDGSDAALAWWRKAADDANELVGGKWKNHNLITEVMIGVMTYLEKKSKEGYT